MRILIFNWRDIKNPLSGGAEIVTFMHAKEWIKKGHTVSWYTTRFPNSQSKEIIEQVNIIRFGNFITNLLYAPVFYILNKSNYDLVIDEIHGLPYFTPLYVEKPIVAFIHEVAGIIWDYMYPFPVNKLGKLFERIYFNFYKKVLFWTDADSTIADLKKYGINQSNCTAINCPANNEIVKYFREKEKKPTFIFVSRVVKMKGIENIIQAFFYIAQKEKNAKLWIVGDGEKNYIKSIQNKVISENLGEKIKFFGFASNEEKLDLMGRAHVLMHASVKEGWGLVVVEAASQGTPSVVYNVAGLCDSVKNGKTGVVLKENSPEELARESLALFYDKKRYTQFQKNGLLFAKSLTWEQEGEKSLLLLNKAYEKNT